MEVTANGVNYHIRAAGEGPPLIVLHGFTGASVNWEPFFSSWGRHVQVFALDIIGHGRTDAPANPERYTMNRAALDLVTILDGLAVDRAHILGYSMGGRLALTTAVRYPNRVKTLVLESGSPGLKTQRERAERSKRDEALADRIERDGVASFAEAWGKLPLFATQSAAAREKLYRQRLQNRAHGLANSLRGMGTGAQASLWNDLSTLAVPVKLVTGEYDEKFCKIAAEMAARLPNADFEAVPEAGHTVHVEQADIFDKMVIEYVTQKRKG